MSTRAFSSSFVRLASMPPHASLNLSSIRLSSPALSQEGSSSHRWSNRYFCITSSITFSSTRPVNVFRTPRRHCVMSR